MLDFIKQLFGKKDRELTFVIFDDREPEPSSSYRFRPSKLLYLCYGMLLVVLLLAFLLFQFTPLSRLLFSNEYEELRTQAIEISKRVESLQDSLEASNLQLTQLKRIVTTGDDTTLSESTADRQALKGGDQKSSEPDHPSVVISGQDVLLAKNELVLYDLFENDPS